ncbi:Hypothetical predicted protein [Mytilus galloprovincialis]|uniref:Uncharacterized protein n=1 Tax=Mytilus galloprovincialis TaxID=29158 RepID=A0A8B6ECD9_MYTGA|nr:Hypothetical predicted protein [Mytilus galloprovincialis]
MTQRIGPPEQHITCTTIETWCSRQQQPFFQPCTSKFDIRENYTDPVTKDLQSPLFEKTRDDDKPGQSYEDKMFMKQMDNEFVRDSEGSWVAPLPFRVPRQPLPSNRQQALHRANMLDTSLNRNPVKAGTLSYIYE